MLATIKSAGLIGVNAYPVDVEVDIGFTQLPSWHMVGLPESEVKESKERVVAAVRNSGYDFGCRKVTINLAPADVRKEGTAFDLPLALGVLSALGNIPPEKLKGYLCVGEVALDGSLRPVRGVLSVAILFARMGLKGLIVPQENAHEAAVVEGVTVYGFTTLSEVVEFVAERALKVPVPITVFNESRPESQYALDFDEICGQYQAKRALEVAASGGHNILFIGSPGAGKTMLASRLPTILPPLTLKESLETSQVYSVLSPLASKEGLLRARPFRAPHHSVSDAGLIGGGSIPRPGEVSMAHNGVLFLDELPEFKKNVLELLRQPLESASVTITRAAMSLTYPAFFTLVAAMNPCPCGYHSHPRLTCTCSPIQVHRYKTKLSGPLLDRIDLQIDVPPIPFDEMASNASRRESSATIAARVAKARGIQKERFSEAGILVNSQMRPKQVKRYCTLRPEGSQILKSIMEKFQLSGRAYDRILKVSRTLADMDGKEGIETKHLLEAVQYRSLDRSTY